MGIKPNFSLEMTYFVWMSEKESRICVAMCFSNLYSYVFRDKNDIFWNSGNYTCEQSRVSGLYFGGGWGQSLADKRQIAQKCGLAYKMKHASTQIIMFKCIYKHFSIKLLKISQFNLRLISVAYLFHDKVLQGAGGNYGHHTSFLYQTLLLKLFE